MLKRLLLERSSLYQAGCLLLIGAAAASVYLTRERAPVCEPPSVAAALQRLPLYVIAGQSNASGLASVRELDANGAAGDEGWTYPNVHVYGIYGAPPPVEGKDDASASLGFRWSRYARWDIARPGFGFKNAEDAPGEFPPHTRAADLFGPELGFARQLHQLNRPGIPGGSNS